ncbi:hypothetical protein [Thermoflavimicrobium daqui]|uniref:Uncharacterized protein n=1 Tax=Thermoflavimicrobium daqui TaxID=2137476 RepID=A0A364K1L9_9BACL|nr:hypothetical protein [Thermoflavimicrobium daqui]RAL21922.1 hypothetical protein DL897_15130 [Thermoflavimicrobium daqui]
MAYLLLVTYLPYFTEIHLVSFLFGSVITAAVTFLISMINKKQKDKEIELLKEQVEVIKAKEKLERTLIVNREKREEEKHNLEMRIQEEKHPEEVKKIKLEVALLEIELMEKWEKQKKDKNKENKKKREETNDLNRLASVKVK